jgi:hypothetical protein
MILISKVVILLYSCKIRVVILIEEVKKDEMVSTPFRTNTNKLLRVV